MRFGELTDVRAVRSADTSKPGGLSLWISTDRLDDLYAVVKRQQMERARAELAGERSSSPGLTITADLHAAFYGQREFALRDPNGVEVMFAQLADQLRHN